MKIISNMIEAHIFRESKNGIEFLLLKRSKKVIYPDLWQMVNGKIKKEEKAFEAAIREIKEETNLTPGKLWVVPTVNSFYSHEKNHIQILPVFSALINSKSKIKLSDEHSDFKWVTPAEAKKMLAWSGQKNSVDTITNYFINGMHFLNFVEIKL